MTYVASRSSLFWDVTYRRLVLTDVAGQPVSPVFTVNPLTLNYDYSDRTAPLTSKRCILYIYSTNIGAEYFKRDIYSPFFSLQNAACFIIITYLVPALFKFYIQGVLKLKKIFLLQKVKNRISNFALFARNSLKR